MKNEAKEKETERRGTSALTRLLGTRKEIKFRAWDTEYEIMTYNPVNKINFAGEIDLWGSWEDLENTCYILMQFTGVVDGNGNEVYEGDIINICEQWEFGETEDMKNHLVVWGGTDYPAFTLKPGLGTEMNELSYLKLACDYNEKFVVVGNIFENPELIDECT